jgi:hypothetical protein
MLGTFSGLFPGFLYFGAGRAQEEARIVSLLGVRMCTKGRLFCDRGLSLMLVGIDNGLDRLNDSH